METVEYLTPAAFYLLFLPAVMVMVYIAFNIYKKSGYDYSGYVFLSGYKDFSRVLIHIPIILIFTGMIFLVVALARPQKIMFHSETVSYGVDIVISLDLSSSMKAIDFKPENRFYVAKKTVKDFIDMRPDDRLGLVIYSGEAVTKCPLTFDKPLLKEIVDELEIGILRDGTAIGDGLAVAIKRLENSTAKSRVILLVTDGINNAGIITPEAAAEIAHRKGIKIYSIGGGVRGGGQVPIETPRGTRWANTGEIDDALLTKISNKTGGSYHRAENPKELERIYEYINQEEKSEIVVENYREVQELFYRYLKIGMILVLSGLCVNLTFNRVV